MGEPNSLASFRGAVDPAEELKPLVIERLGAEADSVDSGSAHPVELGRVDRARICLQRDLGAALEAEAARGRGQDRRDRFRLEERRRAAAEENRLEPPSRPWSLAGAVLDLGDERAHVVVLGPARDGVRVEIAIRAFGLTVWDVKIERERGRAVAVVVS